jgi:hypothetical protein
MARFALSKTLLLRLYQYQRDRVDLLYPTGDDLEDKNQIPITRRSLLDMPDHPQTAALAHVAAGQAYVIRFGESLLEFGKRFRQL